MPAVSQQQQKIFGLALAVKRGEVSRSEASQEVLDIVDSMSEKDIEDFASTKHDGLPKKVEQKIREMARQTIRERMMSEAKFRKGDMVRVVDNPKYVMDKKKFAGMSGYVKNTIGRDIQVTFPNGRTIMVDPKDLEMNPNESVVNERKPSKIVWDTKKISDAKRINVRKWYMKTYPTDELGDEIDKRISLWDVYEYLSQGRDAYKIIGVGDSIVRERIFEKLSKVLGVDYDTIYNMWESVVSEAKGKPKFKVGQSVNYIPKLSGLSPNKKLQISKVSYKGGDELTQPGWYYQFKGTNLSSAEKDIKLAESVVNEADVVGKTVFSDGKGKLVFGYYKDDDGVTFVDYKTWAKLNMKDVSKGDTNKDRVIKAILKNQKQFNKKVDYNMWAKKTNPSFEQKMDWFIKNGWISNINKGGIRESVNEASDDYDYANELQNAVSAVLKGKGIRGWKLYVDYHTGAFEYMKKGIDLVVYATPMWEGDKFIPFNVMDMESEDVGMIQRVIGKGETFKPTYDIRKDVSKYISIMTKVLSKIEQAYSKLKKESVVNEGKFKVDDLVYNKRTKTVGIVRMGDDKYGEVKTDADGNVSVDELEKYNPIKFKHQSNAKVAPSTEREVSKRGLFNPFKLESVNEAKVELELDLFKNYNQRRPDKTMKVKVSDTSRLSQLSATPEFNKIKKQYDYIEWHYGDKFLGSMMKQDNWEFKKGSGLSGSGFKESINK